MLCRRSRVANFVREIRPGIFLFASQEESRQNSWVCALSQVFELQNALPAELLLTNSDALRCVYAWALPQNFARTLLWLAGFVFL